MGWLGHVERKSEEEVVMRTWKTEVGGHRKIGRPKLRYSDVIYKKRHKGKKIEKSATLENVEIDNSMQIGKRQKKRSQYYFQYSVFQQSTRCFTVFPIGSIHWGTIQILINAMGSGMYESAVQRCTVQRYQHWDVVEHHRNKCYIILLLGRTLKVFFWYWTLLAQVMYCPIGNSSWIWRQ